MTPTTHRQPALGLALIATLMLLSTGCALGYYTRTVWGGAKILAQRDSIDRLVGNPRTAEELRQRLLDVQEVRDFASRKLGLPDNKSYRSYSEVRKAGASAQHVVWNVVAAPEFSVSPLQWCFPFAGCVPYRGYFSQARAERFAARLGARGYDLDLYGVRAYSTLGHFADPVLSTFLSGSSPTAVAGYLFHELAHQVAYTKGDATFNESFAALVEEEGLRRWLDSRGEGEEIERYLAHRAHDEEFLALVLGYREKLAACYAEDRADAWKRAEKTRLISRLRQEYEMLQAGWTGDRRWDNWFDDEVNNADFALLASYHDLVPGLRRLLEQQGNDLPAFYREVARLASLGRAERHRLLSAGHSAKQQQRSAVGPSAG